MRPRDESLRYANTRILIAVYLPLNADRNGMCMNMTAWPVQLCAKVGIPEFVWSWLACMSRLCLRLGPGPEQSHKSPRLMRFRVIISTMEFNDSVILMTPVVQNMEIQIFLAF